MPIKGLDHRNKGLNILNILLLVPYCDRKVPHEDKNRDRAGGTGTGKSAFGLSSAGFSHSRTMQ
jgi:hypothetical protein